MEKSFPLTRGGVGGGSQSEKIEGGGIKVWKTAAIDAFDSKEGQPNAML